MLLRVFPDSNNTKTRDGGEMLKRGKGGLDFAMKWSIFALASEQAADFPGLLRLFLPHHQGQLPRR